jgi:hypothetical protein
MVPARHLLKILPPAVGTSLLLAACWSSPLEVPDQPNDPGQPVLQDDRMAIENDAGVLESKIERLRRPLIIVPPTPIDPEIHREMHPQGAGATKGPGLTLTLVAEVPSPVVDGITLQANDVDIQGGTAVIAYNVAGAPMLGAVQVLDVSRPAHPELLSEVTFPYADVNAVTLRGSQVFIGMASTDTALATPALLELLELDGDGLAGTDRWIDFGSFSPTDMSIQGSLLAVGLGALDGGVAVLDRHTLEWISYTSLEDVRALHFNGGNRLYLAGGKPSGLYGFETSGFSSAGVHPVRGYNNLEAKGTLEAFDRFCYLGAGDGGFRVIEGETGRLVGIVENPNVDGLAPELVVCNAASVEQDKAFLANGGAGLRVVDLGVKAQNARRPGDFDLRVLGRIDFSDEVSVNMVKARGDVLVAASGLGGVKFVQMAFPDEGGGPTPLP